MFLGKGEVTRGLPARENTLSRYSVQVIEQVYLSPKRHRVCKANWKGNVPSVLEKCAAKGPEITGAIPRQTTQPKRPPGKSYACVFPLSIRAALHKIVFVKKHAFIFAVAREESLISLLLLPLL